MHWINFLEIDALSKGRTWRPTEKHLSVKASWIPFETEWVWTQQSFYMRTHSEKALMLYGVAEVLSNVSEPVIKIKTCAKLMCFSSDSSPPLSLQLLLQKTRLFLLLLSVSTDITLILKHSLSTHLQITSTLVNKCCSRRIDNPTTQINTTPLHIYLLNLVHCSLMLSLPTKCPLPASNPGLMGSICLYTPPSPGIQSCNSLGV